MTNWASGMAGRLIAIGDVHGCLQALTAVLQEVSPQPDDTLVTLGDYVDRGPDSCGVLNLLIDLASRCQLVPLLGNHEEMMLDVLDGQQKPSAWLRFGGLQTLESYGFDGDLGSIPPEHVDFLRCCRDSYETAEHFFVHGNYLPEAPIDQQTSRVLRWESLRDLIPGPHYSGKRAVVGHTAQKSGEILVLDHLLCIDTWCYGGGWLTAIDLGSGQLWQADMSGQLRQ